MRLLNWYASPDATLTAAVEALREGGLVAFPTDTLYGLAADAMNDEAIRTLFKAKRRSPDEPIPILIASAEQAGGLMAGLPDLALKLGSRFWPGPLTIVLKRPAGFNSLALGGSDSIGLRVPAHEAALTLIRSFGGPITGTSANRSGEPPPRTAEEVIAQLDGDVDIVIDAGPCPLGIESTVVDLREGRPRLLREGAVSREELKAATGVEFDVKED